MKTFNYSGYLQTIKENDILCSCRWGTVHADAWIEGKTLCKHIRKVIGENIR